jgi:diguanylate cyclase (GGDEF)-like protein
MSTGLIFDGIAGSECIDSSGEVLRVKGADCSSWSTPGGILFNYEHAPKEKGPGMVVGRVIFLKKIYEKSDCDNERQKMYWDRVECPFIYVVGRLFDGAGHQGAQALAAIMRDNAANNEPLMCRLSVEGSTLVKDANELKESIVRAIAITTRPCNRTATTELIEDPDAPNGFEKKHVKQKVKDLLDLEDAEKNEFADPLYRRLGGSVDAACSPLDDDSLLKAYTAGSSDAVPSTLTGGAALQREDLGPHSVAKQAAKALHEYDFTKPFDKAEFRAYAKSQLPEASDEFLDHFADMADDYRVKRSLIKKEPTSAPGSQKMPNSAAQPKAPVQATKPATTAPIKAPPKEGLVKLQKATIRGVPVAPTPNQDFEFDEKNGILHTPRGSFPLYNPDKGFKAVTHEAAKRGAFYKNGILHVAPGTKLKDFKQHNGPNPKFREIFNSAPIEDFHSGKVMPNWLRSHRLNEARRLPEEVVMHAAVFSMLSPNTPVRPHELMHAHMVDTWEDLGIDPRDPDFSSARAHWFGKDQAKNYPRIATDYFKEHKDAHLKNASKFKGRVAGDLQSFMLGDEKFDNIAQYHKLHQTLVDLVKKHGTDARAATAELMQHKAAHGTWQGRRRVFSAKLKEKLAAEGLQNHHTAHVEKKVAEARGRGEMGKPSTQDTGDAAKRKAFEDEATKLGLRDDLNETAEKATQEHFGDYQGVQVPGLAPKTGRFMFTMLGGGNSFVPDTHIVRHLFGMQSRVDSPTLAYIKENVLWNERNHHLLEGIDRWYAKNHPAAKLMQEHPQWGKEFKDKEQANFPAFWRHWCCIAQDERNRGIGVGSAKNEFSTHEPYWLGIDKFVKTEGPKDVKVDDKMVAKMIALHKQYEKQYGEIPAQMMFYSHLLPHLIEAGQYRERHDDLEDFAKSVKADGLAIELRKNAADIEIAKFSDPTVPSVHSVDYRVDNDWHRAGRYMLADGKLTHLEDYYGLLKRFLPAGNVTMQTIGNIHGLKMSPHVRIQLDQPDLREGGEKKDESMGTDPQQPTSGGSVQPEVPMQRPPSVFEYQRVGHDKPHTIEVHDGVYLMDGNRMTHPEVQTILDNHHKGAATLRYKQDPSQVAVQKMELILNDLMKANEDEADPDESLQQVRDLVSRGLLHPKYERALTRHIMADSRVPTLGNAYAFEKFKQQNKPGTYVQMDGNDFKSINDAFGHDAGNGAISSFGQAAREAMDETVGKENGKLFRNGGDEFVAHVPSHEHAAAFSRALSSKLQNVAPIGGVHRLSMSFGFGHNPESADAAMYEAKKQKLHPVTGQRVYKVGQVPNLAHSNVPGKEGPVPVHDEQADLLHTHLKTPPKPITIAPPSPKEDAQYERTVPVAAQLNFATTGKLPTETAQGAAPKPAELAPPTHA